MTDAEIRDRPQPGGRHSFARRPFGRRAEAPLVIEGEAIVLSRRAGASRDVPLQGDWAGGTCADASAPASASAGESFLLRAALAEAAAGTGAAREPAPADLIFPGLGLGLGRVAGAPPRGHGARGTVPAAAAGAAAGLVAMAAVAFAALPEAPPRQDAALATAGGVTIGEVAARVEARNGGAVLAVEGVIRNASASPRPVPPMTLSLSQPDGVVRAKPVVPLGRALGPGEVLRFQTMVAVPPGSRAEDATVAFAQGSAAGRIAR